MNYLLKWHPYSQLYPREVHILDLNLPLAEMACNLNITQKIIFDLHIRFLQLPNNNNKNRKWFVGK